MVLVVKMDFTDSDHVDSLMRMSMTVTMRTVLVMGTISR